MDHFIGLGIISTVLIAALIGIAVLVKACVKHLPDYFKYRKNPKPWLRHKEWVDKKIIWKGLVRGSLVYAFGAVAILPVLIALIININTSNKKNLIEIIPFLLALGALFGFFVYAWLRQRKFGRSICYIETLPGEIGGSFKAKVEMYFPNERPKDFNLILRLLAYDFPGQRTPSEWKKEQVVRRGEVEYIGNKKYMVPVHIDIPADAPIKKHRNVWRLCLKCNTPGINYYSQFHIPVFNTKKYK
jgi:hypothetical protein